MCCPQGTAKGNYTGMTGPAVAGIDHISDERHGFIKDETHPLLMPLNAPARITARIAPGLLIDCVN